MNQRCGKGKKDRRANNNFTPRNTHQLQQISDANQLRTPLLQVIKPHAPNSCFIQCMTKSRVTAEKPVKLVTLKQVE